MRQIDIMVAHKRSEWEAQSQAVQARLQVREEELHTALDLLEHRHKEVTPKQRLGKLMPSAVHAGCACPELDTRS
ncbi:UNVERIFIED_CONTAM: hypothetical protein FKN15_036768 [Acipenser sinensis]